MSERNQHVDEAGVGRDVSRTQPTTISQVTEILDTAVREIGGRATLYDQPDGEESMPKVVALFNRLYDENLTVEQGWMFMVLLKSVRSSNGNFKMDNYVDLAAYAAFAGKAARDARQINDK